MRTPILHTQESSALTYWHARLHLIQPHSSAHLPPSLASGTLLRTLGLSAIAGPRCDSFLAILKAHLPATPIAPLFATPITISVHPGLADEKVQKLFSLIFGKHLRRDPDALQTDLMTFTSSLGVPEDHRLIRDDHKINGRSRDMYRSMSEPVRKLCDCCPHG